MTLSGSDIYHHDYSSNCVAGDDFENLSDILENLQGSRNLSALQCGEIDPDPQDVAVMDVEPEHPLSHTSAPASSPPPAHFYRGLEEADTHEAGAQFLADDQETEYEEFAASSTGDEAAHGIHATSEDEDFGEPEPLGFRYPRLNWPVAVRSLKRSNVDHDGHYDVDYLECILEDSDSCSDSSNP